MTRSFRLSAAIQKGSLDVPNAEVGFFSVGGAFSKRLLNHMRAFDLLDLRSYLPSRLPSNQRFCKRDVFFMNASSQFEPHRPYRSQADE